VSRAISPRTTVAVVMVCHFIAAFAALGMPPFFTLILEKSLHADARFLAGWLYVVPTLFVALSSPWWGRIADRYGKKLLLVRAQLGLAGSFLLAGFAPNVTVFVLALALQGVLGGTFAASNAYLAGVVSGPTLTRSLTAMQGSARAALVAAPICLGVWLGVDSPIELYRYLAALPLIAAALIWALPDTAATASGAQVQASSGAAGAATPQLIYALQFLFVFATVLTFPYFVAYAQARFPQLSGMWLGVLFGLPHLAYLMTAAPLAAWLVTRPAMRTLGVAFAALMISLAAQTQVSSLGGLVAWRLMMGLAMTAGFIALHALIAGVARAGTAGRLFGRFESSSKWGAVCAGLCAGWAAELAGSSAPFVVGAAVMALALAYLVVSAATRAPVTEP